ncbi:Smr/MutS family protein [Shimia sp. Alg240-R146]|uniref:Smr/MutS family protein n=1 Tax=Shimia sp. Alg240-R146 TaxID=2993449 RepID=UPI0022E963CC|nr:Smr/MutS family protein [Shimia sp. Alg240-R146]
MKRRRLTEEEMQLWRKVASSAERLLPEARSIEVSKPKPKPEKVIAPRIGSFEIGARSKKPSRAHDLMPSISERVAKQPVQMDKKAFGRLKRGKLKPEGKIDLHGLTAQQAHGALTGFVMRSHAEGKRLVLVITGKGKSKFDDGPIPTRRGVLKHQVPQWLSMPPLAACVLQVAEAHQSHGGSGAYYVYLRRH